MSIYLGQLGRMIELKCPSSQQLAVEDATSFKSTLEGRRIAQVSPAAGRRSWQCQLSDASTPTQIAAVMSFINREWGPGPFVFVSADAPALNLLPPETASCDPALITNPAITEGGPMLLLGEDFAGRSYFNSTPSVNLSFTATSTPVIPGTKVTASAYLRGAGAQCFVSFWDEAGTFVQSFGSPADGVGGGTRRLSVTATVPAGAVRCAVYGVNATRGARPALTWTDTLMDWADGQGCPKVVIHGASRDLVMASRDPRGGRYSNLSFTVSEVG